MKLFPIARCINFQKIIPLILLAHFSLYSQTTTNAAIATVGSHKIYKDQFVQRYGDYLFSTGIKDNIAVREAILDNMINEILLYHYDDNQAIFSNDEFQKEMVWAERQSVLAYLKDQEVYAKIKVDEAEIRQAFLRVNEKLAASHLYASTLEEADYLYNLLQSGVGWDNLAAQVFTDSTLRNNGGYLGYFTWGDMDPSFEDAAYSLKIGEISKPIKTSNGYSIIRLEDRNSHPLLTETEFQTKKSKLERVLRIKKKPEYEKKYIESVFNEKKYAINEKSLDNISRYFGTSDISDKEKTYKPNPNETCASYNGKKFSEQFIIEGLKQIPAFHRIKISSKEILNQAVKGLVLQNLLYTEAVKKKYDKNPLVIDVAEKLKMQTFLKYKMQQIFSGISISDSILYQFYLENRESFKSPNEISVQEILISSKSLADSLLNLLNEGYDFGELAKKHSLREFSRQNNGIINYSPVSNFGFMKSKFWTAEIGKIIGPTELFGAFGIFKVLGKKYGQPKDFESIKKSELELVYKNDYGKKLRDDYIQKIRKQVPISINLLMLNSLSILN
ncbi:MAG: peptidylprolyl isomerase [Ignavibacteriaceae bacterium]|nr:peptidylprolyl isomerase [Ignavibacteriaceae bacterium]